MVARAAGGAFSAARCGRSSFVVHRGDGGAPCGVSAVHTVLVEGHLTLTHNATGATDRKGH